METKADIRRRILKRRREQPQEEQDQKSLEIQKMVLANDRFCTSEWVYLYMDCNGEVQTWLLLQEAFRMGKRVALPRVDGAEMDFYEIQAAEDVQPGYFGILEPAPIRKAEEASGFMAVPGVAFSKECDRLGYGKGFYDRYLSRYPGIYTCGLAYEFQMVGQLPAKEHDMRLCEVVFA